MSSQPEGGDSAPPDAGFMKFLEVALQESPADIAEQLTAGLTKRYKKPPLDELELCFGRSVPLDKARQLLFAPDDEAMRLYPDLIAMPPPGAPDSHPQRLVQVCALASLYLVHSKSWERVRPFIEAGGLSQLANALTHTNPYLASQAMSTLLHITDEDLLFPWHDPPAPPDGREPQHGPHAAVWRRMYGLSSGPFLPNLLAQYRHPPAFPGASGMALRLFAFYVSWMRRHFTQDGRMSLSGALLGLLQRWGADEGVTEEERQLAQQLHKDFSRCPPAQGALTAPNGGGAEAGSHQPQQPHLGGLSGAGDEEYEVAVVSERTEINSGPSADNEAEVLREQGNEAYKCGNFTAAVHLYSGALDVLVPTERLLTEAPRRAAYHANRAAAYMARAAAGRLREGDADTAGHLAGVDHGSDGATARHYEAAVLDCDLGLDMEPSGRAAVKTILRKCRALQQLGRAEEAGAAARVGLVKCEGCEGSVSELRSELQEVLRALGLKERGGEERRAEGAGVGSSAGGSAAVTTLAEKIGSRGPGDVRGGKAVDWNAMD